MSNVLERAGAVVDGVAEVHQAAPVSASDRQGELFADAVAAVEVAAEDGELELAPEVLVLQLVAKAGLVTADIVADRLFRREAEELIRARPRTDARLHRMVLKGYLESRAIAYQATNPTEITKVAGRVAGVAFDQAFTLTQKASLEFNLPLPPTLHESFITHHVKTMEAIWQVERSYRARGYEVLSWETESELVREHFHGKVFRRVRSSRSSRMQSSSCDPRRATSRPWTSSTCREATRTR